MLGVQCKVCSVQGTLYRVQYFTCSIHCVLFSVKCVVFTVQYVLFRFKIATADRAVVVFVREETPTTPNGLINH